MQSLVCIRQSVGDRLLLCVVGKEKKEVKLVAFHKGKKTVGR